MNKGQLIQFVTQQYGVDEEYLWNKYPGHAVFRHPGTHKWFALIMDIPKSKLGLDDDEMTDILNLKCDPLLIGSLREEKGFYPAYHMNKTSWITIGLDDGVGDQKIKWLLDMSYELTGRKKKRKLSTD